LEPSLQGVEARWQERRIATEAWWRLPDGRICLATPVVLRVVDQSDGLPNVPGVEQVRDPDTMPEDDLPPTTRFADATFVGKSFDLAESGRDSQGDRSSNP
jgi:hypothetical protein